jgi:hypothetical protein
MKNIIFILSLFIAQNAFAGATGAVLGDVAKGAAVGAAAQFGGQKIAETVAPELTKKLGNFMGSPPGTIILAGIGGINSGILYQAAADQEKETDANIKKIERILAEFKDSYANHCPNGREKVEDPSCYCYLDNGKQNTNRSNSQSCQQLWAKNKYFYDSTLGTYAGTGTVDPAGCLTYQGQFDENCQCKKMINSAGQNACKKTIGLNVSGNPLGAAYVQASGLQHVMTNLTQTASGNSNLDSLSTGKLAMAIAKQNDINNGIFANLPAKKQDMIKNGNQIEAYSGAVFTKKNLDSMSSQGSALAMNSSGSLAPEQEKLLKSVTKKVGIELSNGAGLGVKKGDKKGETFNFMDAGASTGTGQVQNFPETEKNYKYKNSDIVTNEGASIFEIISNRYVETGLKRLFENPEDEKAAK